VRGTRLATVAVVLGTSAVWAIPSSASAGRPAGVDDIVSVSAKARATTLATPRLHTKTAHSLLVAFVVASGSATGERVRRISGGGLRWSPVVRGDDGTGATEVWQARAQNWWSGRIVATLASAAYPASVTVIAYGGSASYVAARAASRGRGSTPRIRLRTTAGSLVWTVGRSEGQRTPALVSSAPPSRRVVLRTFERRRRTGAWIEVSAVRSSHVESAVGASRSRSWSMVAVDVVVPGLKQLIEAGLLTAYGAAEHGGPPTGVALPRYCPPNPSFEIGVHDDPVFLGRQPAMSPTRGFELATTVFHARLLRLNMVWGEVKRSGWAPYDRAVQMARERCWAILMTIMPTPRYAESYLNSELSGLHLNLGLVASFSTEIATRYRGQVERFAIDNEPDGSSYLPPSGSLAEHMATYDSMYMAGYRAVKAADPSAAVIAGELGGMHVSEWLANVAALPSSGVGIHPYNLTRNIAEFVKYIAPVQLLATEDGVQAWDPNQLEKDLEREEVARRAGAGAFIFYQLSRADTAEGSHWNSGIE
jgi:hypothetical protein